MEIGKISGFTRVLGESQGYLGLPVRDNQVLDPVSDQVVNSLSTAWIPNKEDLERLNAGAPIIVSMFCVTPHPMLVSIGQPTKEEKECHNG